MNRPIDRSESTANCLFCRIAAGTEPSHCVLDEPSVLAFLDVRPLFCGHVLVIPRQHHETLSDLPEELVEPLFSRVRATATAVERALGCAGTFVAINNKVSQSVPHLHVHVVPRNRKDGLRGFFWPRTRYDDDAHAESVAATIRTALEEAGGR
jgi:histidine triad (HIT) family protein